MANNANQAKRLLNHYFRLLAKKSGVPWDSDNDSEIEQIVDLIIAAAVDEIEARSEPNESFAASHEVEFKRNRNEAMGY